MPSGYSRSSRRSSRRSSYRRSSKNRSSGVDNRQTIKNILDRYLRNYIPNPQNPYFYLSKANIKLLALFILSTIKLDDNRKGILYKILLNNGDLEKNDLESFHKIMYGIGISMHPIVYDNRAVNMSNFVASNYISILCENNGMENITEILFNVKKIVGDIFDDNCNVVSPFRNDNKPYVLENVFIRGQKILDYINKTLNP